MVLRVECYVGCEKWDVGCEMNVLGWERESWCLNPEYGE